MLINISALYNRLLENLIKDKSQISKDLFVLLIWQMGTIKLLHKSKDIFKLYEQ